MGRKARNTLAQSGRLESQKISGGGRSVFLDFSFYRTYQELAADRFCHEVTSPKRGLENGRARMTRKPKVLETKFQTDIRLPLLGMVTDGRHEAAQERIAESCF